MNAKNLHTLTTTTTGSKCSQKEANNQTEYQSHNTLGSFFTGSWSWMKSGARHTLSHRGLSEIHLRLVNLTENAV